jgi:hypothetical protein
MLDNNDILHSQRATSQAASTIKNTLALESSTETVSLFGYVCWILFESTVFKAGHVISNQPNRREKNIIIDHLRMVISGIFAKREYITRG